jgi:hypothetical protein
VTETIQERIQLLTEATKLHKNYKYIIHGGDPRNLCTDSEIHAIKMKAIFLCCALKLALVHMDNKPHSWTWHQCCEEAVKILNEKVGLVYCTSADVLRQWNRQFRSHNGKFVLNHHHRDEKSSKANVPS